MHFKPILNSFFGKIVLQKIIFERTLATCRSCTVILSQYHNQLCCFSPSRPNSSFTKNTSILGVGSCTEIYNAQEILRRYKSKKSQKRPEYDSDSDDEEESDDEGMSKSTKPVTLRVQSLRLDAFLKKTLGVARNKVETAFYEGNIRVNGTKPSKKNYQVRVADEVDLIKGVSPLNPDFLAVSRVEVMSVKEDPDEEDQLIVKIRRTKTMYIENYESDPWKKSSLAE